MRNLRRTRFATVLQYCGEEVAPGKLVEPEWRDYSHREPTLDQKRIERHLANLIEDNSVILHVGVGNSHLAQRFSNRCAAICGITIDAAEQTHALSLRISNYSVLIRNKYASSLQGVDGSFNYIIENSPGSFACCLFHFCRLMVNYAALLRPGGRLLSAEPGLSWSVSDDSNWWLSWDDWSCIAAAVNLDPTRLDKFVYSMQRPLAQGSDMARAIVPILMYHSVTSHGPPALERYRVLPEAFQAQLRYLSENGYYSLSLYEWAACLAKCEAPQGRPVVITFDDGYKDFLTGALPCLEKLGFSATIFVVTGNVGGTADWDSPSSGGLELMDWEELRQIRRKGMAVESHCAAHKNLLEMPSELIAQDAKAARAVLQDCLGIDSRAVAFPWGLSDDRSRNALVGAGYTIGLSASGGRSTLADDVMNLPRVEICNEDDLEAFARKLAPDQRMVPSRATEASMGNPRTFPPIDDLAARVLAGRLGKLIDEFISIRTELAQLAAEPDTLEKRLLSMFTQPESAIGSAAVTPYAPIWPGVRFGFQPSGELSLALTPKTDAVRIGALNSLTVAFTGSSTFLSLEVDASWAELRNAASFRLAICAESSRPVSCHAVLRMPLRETPLHDFPLLRFDVLPGRRTLERSGEIHYGELGEADERRPPAFLIFFDTDSPLTVRLEYLNLRLN